MKRIQYYILPLFYLLIGGLVTSMLVQRLLHFADTVWLVLLLPMLMVTVFLTVMGVVNVWIQYRSWRESKLMRQYGLRSLLWLYVRCWLVVMSGLTIGVVFYWMHDLLPIYIQQLLESLQILFYVMTVFLTFVALMSVVQGENLEEIRLRNAQSENQLLKSQLNPHFLYNTLNNIDALIWIDQERASSAVNSLSQLMRYFTYSARQEFVPLSDEVEHLRLLIDLQRLRMPKSDSLVFHCEGDCENLRIAPLLLTPLAENCFKHCGQLDVEHAIVIRLEVCNGIFSFSTDNNLKTTSESDVTPENKKSHSKPQGGVGLSVLRQRLQLLYPGRHTFTAGIVENRFRTSLTINVG